MKNRCFENQIDDFFANNLTAQDRREILLGDGSIDKWYSFSDGEETWISHNCPDAIAGGLRKYNVSVVFNSSTPVFQTGSIGAIPIRHT